MIRSLFLFAAVCSLGVSAFEDEPSERERFLSMVKDRIRDLRNSYTTGIQFDKSYVEQQIEEYEKVSEAAVECAKEKGNELLQLTEAALKKYTEKWLTVFEGFEKSLENEELSRPEVDALIEQIMGAYDASIQDKTKMRRAKEPEMERLLNAMYDCETKN